MLISLGNANLYNPCEKYIVTMQGRDCNDNVKEYKRVFYTTPNSIEVAKRFHFFDVPISFSKYENAILTVAINNFDNPNRYNLDETVLYAKIIHESGNTYEYVPITVSGSVRRYSIHMLYAQFRLNELPDSFFGNCRMELYSQSVNGQKCLLGVTDVFNLTCGWKIPKFSLRLAKINDEQSIWCAFLMTVLARPILIGRGL
jgi:hypothetical protein